MRGRSPSAAPQASAAAFSTSSPGETYESSPVLTAPSNRSHCSRRPYLEICSDVVRNFHTSDLRGIWQCGDVCVYRYGNLPSRTFTIDGANDRVIFEFKREVATLNGKRCKPLEQTPWQD